MFEDSKVVNKYCKLKKVRQYNGQKKRQRTNNCNKKKTLCNMNPNKHWGELTCSGRESSSCFSHHVTLVKNLVISLKEDMRTCDYNKQNICLWSSVIQIIHTDKQNMSVVICKTDNPYRQTKHMSVVICNTDNPYRQTKHMSVVICNTDNPYRQTKHVCGHL